jgi:hypothetical protein
MTPITHRAALACAAATLITAFSAPTHAEILSNQLLLSATADGKQFSISAPFTSTPGGPSMGFKNSINRSTALSSLFRFERQIKGVTLTLAGSGDLFVVKQGQVLTDATLRSGSLTPLVGSAYFPPPAAGATVGREFWLAIGLKPFPLATAEGAAAPYVHFSWARVRFNVLGIPELLQSATGFNEPGLIVGQSTPIQP